MSRQRWLEPYVILEEPWNTQNYLHALPRSLDWEVLVEDCGFKVVARNVAFEPHDFHRLGERSRERGSISFVPILLTPKLEERIASSQEKIVGAKLTIARLSWNEGNGAGYVSVAYLSDAKEGEIHTSRSTFTIDGMPLPIRGRLGISMGEHHGPLHVRPVGTMAPLRPELLFSYNPEGAPEADIHDIRRPSLRVHDGEYIRLAYGKRPR